MLLAFVILLGMTQTVLAVPHHHHKLLPLANESREVLMTEELELEMELTDFRMQRNDILNQLKELQAEVELALRDNDKETIDSLMTRQMEKEFWPQLLQLSKAIYDDLDEGTAAYLAEYKYQEEIQSFGARLRYIAGTRHCLSPKETFHLESKRCLRIGSTDACPSSLQILYDGRDNVGVCDCIHDGRELVYHKASDNCHQLNTQGPCKTGEWLDQVQGIPTCLPVPPDCPVDGQHVFVPSATARIVANTETLSHQTGECLQLFTQGPCSKGLVLRRVESDDLSVRCDFAASETMHGLPALLQLTEPCHRGSRRSQNNQCPLQ